jgi:hypothetical protein
MAHNYTATRASASAESAVTVIKAFSFPLSRSMRSEHGAAQRHDPFGALAIESDVIPGWKQSFESVPETNYFPAKFFRGEHDTAQHGVQSRAISATGQNPNPCFHLIVRLKHFFRIDQPAGGGPLIVELPSLGDELRAFLKSIRTPE